MPRYLNKKIASLNGAISGTELYPALYSAKSVEFFNTLSDKLVDMSQSLKNQFDILRLEALARPANGPEFAAIDAPSLQLDIGSEYFQYINLYGPPTNGQFDQTLLEKIRVDMGISVN